MEFPHIQIHTKITNIYVQKKIIRENIDNLNKYKWASGFNALPYDRKREITAMIDAQVTILFQINKKIKENEQTSFQFGSSILNSSKDV